MSISHWEKNTAQAVINIIDGMASGDFSLAVGSLVVKEIIKYRLDMAVSIWQAWFERPAYEMEIEAMRQILDEHYRSSDVG
jgi:hypothetical protein